MRPGTFKDHVHQAFTEAVENGKEVERLMKVLDDIAYVAEFGHPAINRKDDSLTLEWIKQAARSALGKDRKSKVPWLEESAEIAPKVWNKLL